MIKLVSRGVHMALSCLAWFCKRSFAEFRYATHTRILFFLMVIIGNCFSGEEKIKLYACYTPSHSQLAFNWFLPSIQDDFILVLETFPQECEDAAYMKPGWTNTTLRKVAFIINAIKENWGKVIIYSDVDIMFARSVKKDLLAHLRGKDVVFQTDLPKKQAGTGFFACRCNDAVLDAWKKAELMMKKDKGISDQRAFNAALKACPGLKIGYLPQRYAHGSMLTGEVYAVGREIFIPNDVILYHANYTIGIELKLHQLAIVKKIFDSLFLN